MCKFEPGTTLFAERKAAEREEIKKKGLQKEHLTERIQAEGCLFGVGGHGEAIVQ